MGHPGRHPWLLACCRLVIYAGAAVGVAALGGVALVLFGVLLVVSTLLVLLVGEVNLIGVLAVGGLGMAGLATAALLLVHVARRVDRAVREAARVPTPLERLHESYVDGLIDERELERRLDRLLWTESAPTETAALARPTRYRRRWSRPARDHGLEREPPAHGRSRTRTLTTRR